MILFISGTLEVQLGKGKVLYFKKWTNQGEIHRTSLLKGLIVQPSVGCTSRLANKRPNQKITGFATYNARHIQWSTCNTNHLLLHMNTNKLGYIQTSGFKQLNRFLVFNKSMSFIASAQTKKIYTIFQQVMKNWINKNCIFSGIGKWHTCIDMYLSQRTFIATKYGNHVESSQKNKSQYAVDLCE